MGYSRGDEIEVTISRESLSFGAGVGYLPDETMVVIVGASDRVGQLVQATVIGYERTMLGSSLLANAKA